MIGKLTGWGARSTLANRVRKYPRQPFRPRLEILEKRELLAVNLLGDPAWTPQGPAPEIARNVVLDPNDPAKNLADGAVQALAVDPADSSLILAGAANGGVWRSTDNGTHWTAETDQFASLSISSIAFSPLDATGQTAFASTGNFSAGFPDRVTRGPALADGVLRSTDGGATWTQLDPADFGNRKLERVVPTDDTDPGTGKQILLAAAIDNGGVYRSIDGGNHWTVALSGDATDLVRDPVHNGTYYAALPGNGIWRSSNDGKDWTRIDGTSTDVNNDVLGADRVLLSLYAKGATTALYAAPLGSGDLLNLYRSANPTGTSPTFTAVQNAPTVFPGGQIRVHGAIVSDLNDANTIYVAGDAIQSFPFTLVIWRVNAAQNTWTPLYPTGAPSNIKTAPHSDSRVLTWHAGNLLVGNDGGIYQLNGPGNDPNGPTPPTWVFAQGDMQAFQFYSTALDAVHGSILGGAQDNDASFQVHAGQLTFQWERGGDGTLVAVDQAADPLHYQSFQSLGGFEYFNLQTDGSGNNTVTNRHRITLLYNGQPLNTVDTIPFITQWRINAVPSAQNRMLLGTTFLYESTDRCDNLTAIRDASGNFLQFGGNVTAMAYGGRRNGQDAPDVAYVGDASGTVWVRTAAGGRFSQITPAGITGSIQAIALDPEDWKTAYAADTQNVFMTSDAGAHWTTITGNLKDPTLLSALVYRSGGTKVLLVGGLGGLYRTLNPDSGANTVWTQFGQNLPNAGASDIHYYGTVNNTKVNTLLVGTFGRGAWTVAGASATLSTAGELQITGDNTVDLRRDPNNPLLLDVFENKGSVTGTATKPDDIVKLSSLQKITVATAGANDDLFLDNTYGAVTVPGGISFAGTGNNSRLSLTGPGQTATWNITGKDAGNIDGLVSSFVHVPNLDGSPARDVFRFGAAGSLSGTIHGHGGGDFLDYSALGTPVTVNLATGQASLTGGVAGVQNVLGSAGGGDRLTGDASGNVLVGHGRGNTLTAGSGRSILIGGFGSNTLTGGPADDLLIAGRTAFDASVDALASLLAEWQRGLPYDQRVAHLKNANSGGLNGGNALVVNATVFLSGRRPGQRVGPGGNDLSRLVGGGGRNWFFTISPSTIADLQSGEQIN